MMMNILNIIAKKNNIKIALLSLMIYSLLLLSMHFIQLDFVLKVQINGIYLILCVVLFITLYYKEQRTIFSPFFLFYMVFLGFTSGHIFLMAVGVEPETISYIWQLESFSEKNIYISITFTIFSIQFFHLGYFISKLIELKIRKFNGLKLPHINWDQMIDYVFYLCTFAAIAYVLYIKLKTNDYSSIYSTSFGMIYNILYLVSLFAIPTYLLLNMNSNKIDMKSTCLMVFVVIINFFIGKRGMAIMFFLPVFFLIIQGLKNISISKLSQLMLFSYLMINLVVTISYTRIADINIFNFFESYFYYLFTFKSIGLLVNEMGFSIRPLVEIVNLISNEVITPSYGGSYIYSIFLILPGFLRFGLDSFAIEHNFVNLAGMVTHYTGANYGLGFSVMAESYLNFKYFGIFFFILLGIVIEKLLEGKMFDDQKQNSFFHISAISILILFPRSPMQDTVKKLLLYCLLPFVLHNIILKKERENESIEENN